MKTNPSPPTMPTPQLIGWGFLAGIAIGLLTMLLQKYLPYPAGQLANSAAVWSVIGFVIGRFARKPATAIVAGTIAVAGQVIAYYTLAYFLDLMDLSVYSLSIVGFWLFTALLSGTIFGLSGYAAFQASGWLALIGRATLPALFMTEGIQLIASLSYTDSGALLIAIGLAILAMLTWRHGQRIRIWLITVAIVALFTVGFQALALLEQWRFDNLTG